MTRRETFTIIGSAFAAARSLHAAPITGMGVATTSYWILRSRDTVEFARKCAEVGAGGVQAPLTSRDAAYLKSLRGFLEQSGMYFELMASLPAEDRVADFDSLLAAAKEIGALCVRVAALSGRRYETFEKIEDWNSFVRRSEDGIRRAVPVAEKHKLPLAIENHKDWTAPEQAALMKRYSSEYLGVCLDAGNNISLLEDPKAHASTLAPFAVSTHIKDMGVAEYADGFLLAEVPLGEGILDLSWLIQEVRKHRPNTRMTLEMMTRDPLKVPCLTEKYWVTFPERNGADLARTLRMVKANPPRSPLPEISGLPREEQLKIEDANVRRCLVYAGEKLGLRHT